MQIEKTVLSTPDGTTTYPKRFSAKVLQWRREQEVQWYLRAVDCISVEDYIAMMLGDPDIITEQHRSTAQRELRSAGFGPGLISLWGHRPIFHRWMRHTAGVNQLARWRAAEARYD